MSRLSFAVTHINLARGFRGGERQTELLIRELLNAGISQTLVARRNQPLAARLADTNIRIRTVGSGLLSAIVATRGSDLVHAHEGRGVYAAFGRAKISGTPYVITRRVNNPIGTHELARRTYVNAAAVAGVADDICRIVQAYDSRIRTCVIHSATSQLTVDQSRVDRIKKSLPGKFIIGNVASLDNQQKGQEYIIDVARELQTSHPDIHFVLVGGGADESMLRAMAKDCANISFAGFVDNVGDYLAALDIFILPSNKEGIGGILLDAMLQKVPVVASRVGGLPEIVRDNQNGLMIEPAQSDQLRDAILQLYGDGALRQRLGQSGYELAQGFGPDVMCAKYLRLYRDALNLP